MKTNPQTRSCFSVSVATTAFFLVSAWGQVANAGIAELPEEELLEASTLVMDAKVVSTACDGNVETDEYGNVITRYVSMLEPLEVIKGEADENVPLHVRLTEWSDEYGLVGCSAPEIALPAGWVGRLYLSRDAEGAYYFEYWNGVEKDTEASVIEEFPTCTTQSVPPTGVDPEPADETTAESGIPDASAGGCSVSGGASSSGTRPWFALGLVGMGLYWGRRRRS